MSAFNDCLSIERESKRILLPWAIARFGNSPKEIANDYDSQTLGDWEISDATRRGYRFNVELKAELDYTGHLFLEAVSNASLVPPRYGWYWTSRADELWYHFLDVNCVYTCVLGELRTYLLPDPESCEDAPLDKYRLVSQRRYSQSNLTQGYIVPVSILTSHCPTFREWKLNEQEQAPC